MRHVEPGASSSRSFVQKAIARSILAGAACGSWPVDLETSFAAREAHLKHVENNPPDDLAALMSMYSLSIRSFLKDHCCSSALMYLAVKARKCESLFSILQMPIHEARPHSL